jgi:dihydroneopterin aldolase
LLESLAEEISDAAFGLSDCEKTVVRVRKPQPPFEGQCEAAEVEIVRYNKNRR